MINQQQVSEDFSNTPVPKEFRRSWLEQTFVTSGFTMAVSGMFAGASLIAGLDLQTTILITIIGNTILALIGGLMGGIGAETGVSTTLLTKHAFGKYGSAIIGILFGLTLVGWFSVQAGFFGQTIHSMIPNAGFISNVSVAAAWGGCLMILTAFIGYKGIRILSNIAIPLLILLCLVGIVVSINQVGGINNLSGTTTNPITFAQGIVMVVGTFGVGAVLQPDISRYSKSRKASWVAIFLSMVISNGFIIVAGAITAISFGTGDLPAAMLSLGLGIPALLILIAAQWTSNDSNLYSASLALANTFGFKKSRMVLIVGIIATILGAAGIANYFTSFLIFIGTAIPPIAGVVISDYYLIRKKAYIFNPNVQYKTMEWNGIIAWLIGTVSGFSIVWGIASINSLIIAFVAHLILSKFSAKKSEEIKTDQTKEMDRNSPNIKSQNL